MIGAPNLMPMMYPIISIYVDQIRKAPAMMDLKLRMVENPDDEYAGCMVLTERKTIAFKIDYIIDLVKAMETVMRDSFGAALTSD